MAEITFRGNPIKTVGDLPPVGAPAPAFTLTGTDLGDVSNDSYAGTAGRAQHLPVDRHPGLRHERANVQRESRRQWRHGDLRLRGPAVRVGRFCGAEGIENVKPASSFRSSFGADFGVTIADGPLAGLLARSVVVLDADGKVAYTELVPEIAQEPNYDAALARVSEPLGRRPRNVCPVADRAAFGRRRGCGRGRKPPRRRRRGQLAGPPPEDSVRRSRSTKLDQRRERAKRANE